MRVLADTNLFINHLLSRGERSETISIFLERLAEGRFLLLLPQDLLDEIVDVVTQKPYLRKTINGEQLARMTSFLQEIGESIPVIEEPIPRICRDPMDDYLLAYALVGRADYLVTGDRDLLTLGAVGSVPILSPAAFVALLDTK